MIFDFNSSSERAHRKLSENHKTNDIGPTELELWPLKDATQLALNYKSFG